MKRLLLACWSFLLSLTALLAFGVGVWSWAKGNKDDAIFFVVLSIVAGPPSWWKKTA